MAHLNVGPYQVLYWPRWTLMFVRRRWSVYRWIIYLWPFEVRRFAATSDECLKWNRRFSSGVGTGGANR